LIPLTSEYEGILISASFIHVSFHYISQLLRFRHW
jgi:hypothetical protein